MPSKYKFLLEKILKSGIVENDQVILQKKNHTCEVPQGGVLSPLLIN